MDEQEIREIELSLEEQRKAENPDAPETRRLLGTHWQGCWLLHLDCARDLIERMTGEQRRAFARQVVLDRIILHAILENPALPNFLDEQSRAEVDRVVRTWQGGARAPET